MVAQYVLMRTGSIVGRVEKRQNDSVKIKAQLLVIELDP
jgi:hypothetical protein